jgi:hypothetical protein
MNICWDKYYKNSITDNLYISNLIQVCNDDVLINLFIQKQIRTEYYALLGYYSVFFGRYEFLKIFLNDTKILRPYIIYACILGLFRYRIRQIENPNVIKIMLLILKCQYMRNLYPKMLNITDTNNTNTFEKLNMDKVPQELKLRFVMLDMYSSIKNGLEMMYNEFKKYPHCNSIWCYKINFYYSLSRLFYDVYDITSSVFCSIKQVNYTPSEYPSVIAKSLQYGSKKDIKICIKLNEYIYNDRSSLTLVNTQTNKMKPVLSNFILRNNSKQVFDYYVYFIGILVQIGKDLPDEIYSIIRKNVLDMYVNKLIIVDFMNNKKYKNIRRIYDLIPEYFVKIYYDKYLLQYLPECIEFTYYNWSPKFVSGLVINTTISDSSITKIINNEPYIQTNVKGDNYIGLLDNYIYPYTYNILEIKAKIIEINNKQLYIVYDYNTSGFFKNRMEKLIDIHCLCKKEYNNPIEEFEDISLFILNSNNKKLWWPLHVYNKDTFDYFKSFFNYKDIAFESIYMLIKNGATYSITN